MYKTLCCIVIGLLITVLSNAQQNTSIGSNEKLVYKASYNMSGLLTEIAQVSMETEIVKTKTSSLLHLKCIATTYSKWDNFFKIRDLYEAYVNPETLKPRLYKRNIYEGGYVKKVKYIFNHSKKTVSSTISKGNGVEQKKTLKLNLGTNDLISTLYQIRNMDIAKASVGNTQKIRVLFDNKERDILLKYVGKESIGVTGMGTKECYKIIISTNEASLQGSEQNIIWLTADTKKIPVLIKFAIPVGTGKLELASAQGV